MNVYSQKAEKLSLQIISSGADKPINHKLKKKNFIVKDSTELYKKLHEIKSKLLKSGYIAASIDSIVKNNANYYAYLNVGLLYKWKKLSFDNADNEVVSIAKVNHKDFADSKISFNKLNGLKELLANYYKNNGYPFVELKIDSFSIQDNYLKGAVKVIKNQKINIDTIIIKGKVNISPKLIYKTINIESGDLFNQQKIDYLDENLNKLSHIQTAKPTELEFTSTKADIYIYLKKRKSNLFNGILGFTTDETKANKLSLSGNINFVLNNSFAIGEHIGISWEKHKDSSQFLATNIVFPYLFFLPIGVDASFQLDKEQLDYMNVNYSIAITYKANAGNEIHTYFRQKRSFLINTEQEGNALYDNTNNYTLGLTIGFDKTERLILPRKGYKIQFSTGYGNRWAEQKGNSYIVEADFLAAFYRSVGNNLTLSVKNISSGIFNKYGFYENEMFKIGGIKSIRGFDEKSIIATAYSIFTLEPQFFISKYSFVSVFADYAYFEEKGDEVNKTNHALGIGAGISIDSKAGIFSLNFAVGKLKNTYLRLSNTKMHFGYIAHF